MIAPLLPLHFHPRESVPGGQNLARLFGLADRSAHVRSGLWEINAGQAGGFEVRLHNASHQDLGFRTDRVTAVHVLWCQDETTSTIRVSNTYDGARDCRVLPGETVTLPAGWRWRPSNGIVALSVGGIGAGQDRLIGPNHGLDVLDGYNRRTVCAAGQGLLVDRWKLTQPLSIPHVGGRPLVVIGIHGRIGVVAGGTVDSIGVFDGRLVSPDAASATLVPDGLAYALVIHSPDLERDVAGPLRRAGYSPRQIESLGINPH